MSGRAISPEHKTVSGSKLVETIGDSLSRIKAEDGLTDAELGRFLHKGVDAGKAYRTGYAEMPVTSFLRGCERWNGRFANDVLAHVGMKLVPLGGAEVSDQAFSTALSRLMLEWSIAMEDGRVDDVELARMKRSLIAAGEAIDTKRGQAA